MRDQSSESGRSPVLAVAGAVLLVVAGALATATVVGGQTGALVAIGALTLLFVAVGAALFLLAREVGSRADDPEEVERRLAEELGSSEEDLGPSRGRRPGEEEESVPSQSALDERFYDSEE